MATISLTIENDGSPIEGAAVCVGEVVGKLLYTDSEGKVTKTVAADFAISALVLVEIGGVRRGTFGPLLLKAGESYVLDIGDGAP